MGRIGLWLWIARIVVWPGVLPAQEFPDALRLRLNLPAYRLEVFEGERLTHRYRVAIGDTAFPTPTGQFEITRVEWHPWWIPPQSDWAAEDSVTGPGPGNPMGRVKLWWQEMYYLHGTPQTHSLGTSSSHGCVRLSNADAVALAKLVHRYATPGVPEDSVTQWAATPGITRRVPLEYPVPLVVAYEIAVVRNDTLVVYPDVYRLAGDSVARHAMAVLDREGYDTTLVQPAELAARLVQAAGRVAVIPIARLMLPDDPRPRFDRTGSP